MKALNPENTLKPAAGQLTYQRDSSPTSGTAIFSGGTAKTSAERVAAGVCRIVFLFIAVTSQQIIRLIH
jgi:hypothetical protein